MGVPVRRRAAASLALLGVVAAGCTTVGCTTGGPSPLVPSEVAQTTAPTVTTNELTVGVDGEELAAGFNPHTLADIGPSSFGVASLVLPSAFRQDAAGVLRPDPTLLVSASVIAQQPYTVSYQLRRAASWSDGAPIAAEDFAYLADRMRTEPGVASPAGYRLIRQVNSRSGGKQVDVVFGRPYPGWRTLFANLLPAHLLKDAPGGWAQALETGIPVSGGPFAMRAVDAGRAMIVLERNDRYWEQPAVLDRLVLRGANTQNLVSALATGGNQLAALRADSVGLALLRERAAGLPVRALPEPVVAEVLLRPAGSTLADRGLRAAVAAALDLADLVSLGSGNGPGVELPARALTMLPSEVGYAPTIPDGLPAMRADAGEVARLLAVAGYQQAGQQWLRDGRPLRLVVAAPAERAAYRALATRVVRQLAAVGIDAELITPTGDELFAGLAAPVPATGQASTGRTSPAAGEASAGGGATASGAVPTPRFADIAIVPRPVSGDPAADLVSWYGCAEAAGDADAGYGPAQADTGAADNPAGYCNRSLQAGMDDLLTGASTLGETLAATEAALWRDLPAVPLFQHAVVLVSGRGAEVGQPGGLLAGPFAGAARWRRAPR